VGVDGSSNFRVGMSMIVFKGILFSDKILAIAGSMLL